MTEPSTPPPADAPVFISYTRADNAGGWVTAFVEQLKAQYLAGGSPDPLHLFFDMDSIREGDDWERTILTGLRNCRAFIAVLSPRYFASDWCRREWEWWTRHEMHRHCLRDGAAPIYYVTVEGFPAPKSPDEIAAWVVAQDLRPGDPTAGDSAAIARAVTGLLPRQAYDLRPFQPADLRAMAADALREKLARLSRQVRELLDRAARAERSPTDLPDYNPAFTGRVGDLVQLRQDLALGATGITAVVHGLGGIGKTELALAYAHAYAHEYPGGRYLVPCAGAVNWRGALERFAALQGWTFEDEVKKSADLHFAQLVAKLHDFAGARGRCLLVCDNVDSLDLLRPGNIARLRLRDDRFHLLFTTRLPAPPDAGPTANLHWHALDSLPHEDAVVLLETIVHACPAAERGAFTELATELGGFTIAVELAGRYLAGNPADSPSAFLARLRAAALPELDDKAERTGADLFRHGEEARLEFILGQTLATLAPEEIRALEYAAQFAPDAVPLTWVRQLLAADFPSFVPTAGADADAKWIALVEHLSALRLLMRKRKPAEPGQQVSKADVEPTAPAALASIHRLVQEVLRKRYEEEVDMRRESAYRLIEQACLFLREHRHEQGQRWMFQVFEATADAWLARCERGEVTLAKAAPLIANDAHAVLRDRAEWGRAESLLRRAKALIERHLDSGGHELASTINNLSVVLQDTNRLPEAEALMREALAIDERRLGPEHPEVAIRLNHLATLLEHTNRVAEAEPLMRRALAIAESSFGPEHPDVVASLNNLARLLQATARHSQAEPLMRRALTIIEMNLGYEHPKNATCLNNLAQLLQATNRLAEAEPLMRRALEIEENVLGPQHPNVAIALNNLGQLLQDTNRLAEAEPLIQRALEIDERTLGPEHTNVAIRLNNLAHLLENTGRLDEAEPLMRRALAIDEKASGPEHPSVAIRLSNLAGLLYHLRRLPEAEPLMRRALAIDENSLGPDHPNVAIRLNNLAALLQATRRLAEAEPLARRAVEIDERNLGPTHPNLAARLNCLATLLYALNRYGEAAPLMRRAVNILAKSTAATGHEHPRLRDAMTNYMNILMKTGLTNAQARERVISALRESGMNVSD